MKSFKTKMQLCPKCSYVLDGHTALTGDKGPSVGDLTVCIGCMQILEYKPGWELAVVDPETLPIEVQEVLAKVIAALLAMKLEGPSKLVVDET